MKRLFLFATLAFLTGLVADAQNKLVKQVKNNVSDQPYKVDFANISIGNMSYTQKVLNAWQDFDNNTLDNSANIFADNVIGTLPDGTTVTGKDGLIKLMKDYRNSLSATSSKVSACTTLKSPSHPEMEVVTIWGEENDTMKDGTTKKTHLNEVWFFNKQGQVVEFHQLSAQDTPNSK
jgi:hypothetical protein